MHELAITQSLLELVLEQARKVEAKKVGKVNVVIGKMSGVVDECVQFYFDFLSADSIASGASLTFTRIPMKVRCRNCGLSFTPDKSEWKCPQCGKWDAEVTAGQELYIDSIEVE